jgi:hypothetical protein
MRHIEAKRNPVWRKGLPLQGGNPSPFDKGRFFRKKLTQDCPFWESEPIFAFT